MSDTSQAPGWWQASDGKWYAPQLQAAATPVAPLQAPHIPPTWETQPNTSAGPNKTPKKPWWRRWWAIALAVFVVIAGIINVASPKEDTEGTLGADTQQPPASAATMDPTGTAAEEQPSAPIASMPETETVATAAPATTEPVSNLTPSQESAIRSAESYLDFSGFSRQGLIDQLSSEFGEQFPVEDATFAVDSLKLDWTAQAVRSAESYLDFSGFSSDGLIGQLSSEFGEQYTLEEATAAVDSMTVDWNAQAARSAQSYLDFTGFSCQGLIDQLSSEFGDQYTVEEARFGATEVGLC